MCRIRRRKTTLKQDETLVPRVLWKDDVGTEPFMPTNKVRNRIDVKRFRSLFLLYPKVDVPICVNLCLIFVYLMMGGGLFGYWENWSISEAAYFTFITLTTIGFGDYVPGNSFSGDGDQALVSMLKMFVTIMFCLLGTKFNLSSSIRSKSFSSLGMALVSMAINLMQQQLVVKAKWLGQQIGKKAPNDPNAMKYQVNNLNYIPLSIT